MKTVLLLVVLMSECRHSSPALVYTCASPHAKKYHYKANCRGLSNCNHRLTKVTLKEAQQSGKTLCSWEK